MPISSLCTKELLFVNKNTPIRVAAALMRERNVGGLAVMDDQEHKNPVGVITDRDIAMGVANEDFSPHVPVAELFTKKVVKVKSNAGIAEVIDKMEADGVRRILVENEQGVLCGLVSSDDIFQLVAREMYGLGRLIEKQLGKTEYRASLQ